MPVLKRSRRPEEEEKILDVSASMQGTMVFKDPVNLRINGQFEGKLDTKGTLTVGQNAEVKADIKGDDITVAGKVTGNIVAAKRLTVIAPANLSGDIITPLLSISEGAILNGRCQMSSISEMPHTLRHGKEMALDEVARYLEVDVSLIEEWAAKKKIPALRENNAWKFFKEDVDNWVAREKVSH
jgi:excisionase family DNA binding protein